MSDICHGGDGTGDEDDVPIGQLILRTQESQGTQLGAQPTEPRLSNDAKAEAEAEAEAKVEAEAEDEDEDEDDVPIGQLIQHNGRKAQAPAKRKDSSKMDSSERDRGKRNHTSRPRNTSRPRPRDPPKDSKREPSSKRSKKAVDNENDDDNDFEDTPPDTLKPGQRFLCPPRSDGARVFYVSLLEENPESVVAVKWCVENGAASGSQLKELLQKYKMLKDSGKFRTPLGGLR